MIHLLIFIGFFFLFCSLVDLLIGCLFGCLICCLRRGWQWGQNVSLILCVDCVQSAVGSGFYYIGGKKKKKLACTLRARHLCQSSHLFSSLEKSSLLTPVMIKCSNDNCFNLLFSCVLLWLADRFLCWLMPWLACCMNGWLSLSSFCVHIGITPPILSLLWTRTFLKFLLSSVQLVIQGHFGWPVFLP